MFFIGELLRDDVDILLNILRKNSNDHITQVGNMFFGSYYQSFKFFTDHVEGVFDKFKFLRGNNDNPIFCVKSKHYLGNYGMNHEAGYFFVSGSCSDKTDRNRKIYIDQFPNEELTSHELERMEDFYSKIKPDIVVTNEIPEIVKLRYDIPISKTSLVLSDLISIHSPLYWIYGIDHKKDTEKFFEYGKTKFFGINKREVIGI